MCCPMYEVVKCDRKKDVQILDTFLHASSVYGKSPYIFACKGDTQMPPFAFKMLLRISAHNFVRGSYKDAQNQERPEYLMTNLGFSVLTMNTTELGIVIETAPCGA